MKPRKSEFERLIATTESENRSCPISRGVWMSRMPVAMRSKSWCERCFVRRENCLPGDLAIEQRVDITRVEHEPLFGGGVLLLPRSSHADPENKPVSRAFT